MKKQNLGLLLGAVWFFGFVAGWSGRGIYEDQKPPQPKPAVSLGEAHKLGWLQGYSATAENEKRGTVGKHLRPDIAARIFTGFFRHGK